ncbi:hypothetical protein N8I77_009599 [Diaporthe amygdali]|uniref:Uncharacterized protein n=1 Tax=Phomopsis amygdali TaxID=1214568 RepID=A0AAD9SAH6_PHOAM|nr:hypothetical protein N8I77_009599 [Diaporthe amygdali]
MHISKPFRFLDLPREVRDEIYDGILCNWPQGTAKRAENQQNVCLPRKILVMDHKIETAILLANKQIYQEARQILIKGNQFIHIKMRMSYIIVTKVIFEALQVPVVTIKNGCSTRFNDFLVMRHSIDMLDGASEVEFDAILLRRDLGLFCKALDSARIAIPHFLAKSKHEITIHNPFTKTSSPDYLNRKNQGRLLEPYRNRLRGFDHVKIGGSIDSDLAKAVVADVTMESDYGTPHQFLAELLWLKEKGNQAFRQNCIIAAEDAWRIAANAISRASTGRTWSHLKEAGGKDFTDRVSELYFQLQSNLTHKLIKDMQASAPDRDVVQSSARLAWGSVREAQEVAKTLGTDWQPSDEQCAKLCYRLAVAHRLGKGNLLIAEASILYARVILPDDKMIQREKLLIEEWKAER